VNDCNHLLDIEPDYTYGPIYKSTKAEVIAAEREGVANWLAGHSGMGSVFKRVFEESLLGDDEFFEVRFSPFKYCPLCGEKL